jgi:CIC family chloride channel protein
MSRYSDGLRYYLLVAAVGLLAASLAVAFYLLYSALWSFTQNAFNYSVLIILPIVFIAIGLPYALVKLFANTKTTGSGTHTVLEAYHLTNGEVSLKDTIVKPAAAILTIGLGGSAGPEGPSLLAGGGVAAALSRRFKVQADLRRRLFIAGAAAGLAATFRTPLTAILFALEIPYKNDLDRETFIEAAIASVPAYLLSITVLGSEPLFAVAGAASLTFNDIALSLLLGLICGLYAVFFTKTFSWTEWLGFKLRRKIGNLGLIWIGAVVLSVSGGILRIHVRCGFALGGCDTSRYSIYHRNFDIDSVAENFCNISHSELWRKRRALLSHNCNRRGNRLHFFVGLQR